jgi:hypothetical protein
VSVCLERHPVGRSRQRASDFGRHQSPRPSSAWLAWVAAGLFVLLQAGCGDHPEELLTTRWQESGWEYEKLDTHSPAQGKWIDGIDFAAYADRRIVRHEAEYWEFRPDGTLIIAKRDGSHVQARWRLKGRGHVLTVREPESVGGGGAEIYDVKELTRDELVLNYDIGMEVRGIARLTFRRLDASEQLASTPRARPSRPSFARPPEGALRDLTREPAQSDNL